MYEQWKPIFTALAADIMDAMGYREQTLEHTVRPTRPESCVAGPAVTLDAYPHAQRTEDPYGAMFALYDVIQSGDVIVLATNSEATSGVWGELLSVAAVARGIHAVVTDGLVRDARQMDAMGFHCFCRGFSPLDSAGRCEPRQIQVPVTCAGVRIEPGDFMLADYEGVVVIPAAIRDEVHGKCLEKLAGENTVRDELTAGRSPREVFDQYGIL